MKSVSYKLIFLSEVVMDQKYSSRGVNSIEVENAQELHNRLVQARHAGHQSYGVSNNIRKFSSPSLQIKPKPRKLVQDCAHVRHFAHNPNNPLCAHCGTVIIPSPKASLPLEDTPSISILNWTITTRKKPILNSQELAEWDEMLQQLALPEMIFGNSFVRVESKKHSWKLEFNALAALKSVKLEDCGIRVSYAHKWIKNKMSKRRESQKLNNTSLDISQNYDWTYTTTYKGTVSGPKLVRDDNLELPIEKLSRLDPILFYDDMILFEDELADNGISVLNVKVRVMDECMLILNRFFLRVDDVLFRIIDTRVYVEFDENMIIREFKRYEGDYGSVLNKHKSISPNQDVKAEMRDSNWVVQNLELVKRECDYLKLSED